LEFHTIRHIPREENTDADALAKLASTDEAQALGLVLVETLMHPSIDEPDCVVMQIDEENSWMTPIRDYLEKGELPKERKAARKLTRTVSRYLIQDGVLYRRGFSAPPSSMC